MEQELKEYIKDLLIEEFIKTKTGSKLKEGLEILENIQNHLFILNEKKDEKGELILKAGTIITFSMLTKFINVTSPNKLNKDDWKDIASDVSNYVIIGDEQDYVTLIFNLYENYIRFSANQISPYVTEDIIKSITSLADQIHINLEQLETNETTEVTYIESNLWLCLEAMIKLVASFSTKFTGKEYGDLTIAIGNYAFEYGRFVLYKKEQALINEFFEEQSQMNDSLKQKYELFITELEQESNKFYTLIDNAFNGNFKDMFNSTIHLALESGVDESEILYSIDNVDSFFLD